MIGCIAAAALNDGAGARAAFCWCYLYCYGLCMLTSAPRADGGFSTTRDRLRRARPTSLEGGGRRRLIATDLYRLHQPLMIKTLLGTIRIEVSDNKNLWQDLIIIWSLIEDICKTQIY